MQYLVFPLSATAPATHRAPYGQLVHIKEVNAAKVVGPIVLADLTGYTPVTVPPASHDTPAALAAAKAAATKTVNEQYAANAGITVNGLTLATGDADRTNFTQLTTHLLNSNSQEPVVIADKAGQLHSLSVAAYKALMAEYGKVCYDAWTGHVKQLEQIDKATCVSFVKLVCP